MERNSNYNKANNRTLSKSKSGLNLLLKAVTHQADVKDLAVTKADCFHLTSAVSGPKTALDKTA